MTFTPFETPEAALAACESAGLQPLVGSDHQFGTKYGVCPPGFSTYINCYGDRDFLAWCNGHFRMVAMRQAAGWELMGSFGWLSPDGLDEGVGAQARDEGRSMSNLIAFLLERTLLQPPNGPE